MASGPSGTSLLAQDLLERLDLVERQGPRRHRGRVTASCRLLRRAVYRRNRPLHPQRGVAADVVVRRGIITENYGLQGRDYVLFVGRLVPEKNVDLLVRAYREVKSDLRLIIAGGSSYTDEYTEELARLASLDDRVVMTGYVYGEELDELYTNAAVFVLPSALEGLPLTLLGGDRLEPTRGRQRHPAAR